MLKGTDYDAKNALRPSLYEIFTKKHDDFRVKTTKFILKIKCIGLFFMMLIIFPMAVHGEAKSIHVHTL